MEKNKFTEEKSLWDHYGDLQKDDNVILGPYTSYQFLNSRRHILFAASRYKFALKMIGVEKEILDLGCNDGFGTHFLGEGSKRVVGVDLDEKAIQFAKAEKSLSDIDFICEDFLGNKYGDFDGIVSFDVIEHIFPQNENKYMETVLLNLKDNGVLLIGTPSLESQEFSKPEVREAHVNLYTGESLKQMLEKHFHNVFMFTQNDEVVHTGHFRMANYLLAVCCNKK